MVRIDGLNGKALASLGLVGIMNLYQINPETILIIMSSLSLLQLFILKLRGSVLIDKLHLEGWKTSLPFYIIKCSKHGYQLTYPSGYNESLICPKCITDK
jgi:hypothetical protein